MSSYFSFIQSVYSEDVDQYSIVYHSNYLKYFERARTEWLLANNLNLTSFAQQGHFFVVSNVNIDFKKPLKLHDKFIVDCEIQSHTKASLTFKQTIKSLEKKMIYCSAQVLLININEQGKITRIPKSIKEILT